MGALPAHRRHAGDGPRLRSVDPASVDAGRGTPRVGRFRPLPRAEYAQLIESWLPLTVAVNSLNRAMGQPDLYPFVLSTPALEKLAFVHALVHTTESP